MLFYLKKTEVFAAASLLPVRPGLRTHRHTREGQFHGQGVRSASLGRSKGKQTGSAQTQTEFSTLRKVNTTPQNVTR